MEATKQDRRFKRSRKLLGDALLDLMQEKRFIDITVQDIIDRADIGRTTFYAHYQDKEDLLISSLEEILVSFIHHVDRDIGGQELLSMVDFFYQVKQHPSLYKALVSGQGIDVLFNKGQAMISQKIEQHLLQIPTSGQNLSIPIPLVANYLAGSFLILLKWWIEHKLVYSPEQMDAIYQELVLPGTLKVLQGKSKWEEE
jgi:AcrR family transcriptional regulator